MPSLIELEPTDLSQLGPQKAVSVFSKLIWAEATRLGIAKNFIDIPTAISVRDGGIDARVTTPVPADKQGQGIVFDGLTCYQIKSGSTFNPSSEPGIKDILFKPNSTELHEGVKNCLEANGTLIIVAFGYDNPDEDPAGVINAYKAKLETVEAKYKNAKIQIWKQNTILSFLHLFPSLVLDLKRLVDEPFQVYDDWKNNEDMRRSLVKGSDYDQRISEMRTVLRSEKAEHIRINAEPGKGKTRFVFEALSTPDLAPLVVYSEKSQRFLNSALYSILCKQNDINCILVVDECSPSAKTEIWNKLRNRGNNIKLITIYNEPEPNEAGISRIDVPNLSEEEIKKIIAGYGVPDDQVNRWIDLAGDSPRFAHMIGANLRSNPDDISAPVDNIYDRLIAGYNDPSSQVVRERRAVLEFISLFKKFGFAGEVANECRVLADKIHTTDSIAQGSFTSIISDLKGLKILQGENTLYITPKILHIWMWTNWWNKHSTQFDYDQFMQDIPEKSPLRDWFNEMFRYAAQSASAMEVVKNLLSENGPLSDQTVLRAKVGADFFLALTEADPKSAIQYLKKTVGVWDKKTLLEFTTGRRQIIWALERIAVWSDYFNDAARILLSLAEAENETYANNASGVFADLFSPGYGRLAPTELPPLDRLPIIEEAINSPSKERRLLAIEAAEHALESDHFTRDVGAEYQGLKKMPNLWMPKTWGEIFAYYKKTWLLLQNKLDSLDPQEQKEVIKVLLIRTRSLGRIPDLADLVFNTLIWLSKRPGADKKEIVKTIVEVIHYHKEEMPEVILRKWESLRDEIIGKGFTAEIKRFVGMDLLEDKFDARGNYVDTQVEPIAKLAKESVQDPKKLFPELPWLVTQDAMNGYIFGNELGKIDKEFSLLPALLEAQRNAKAQPSIYFLGGYFSAMHTIDPTRWEKELTAFASDETLKHFTVELAWRSGINDAIAVLILKLFQEGSLTSSQLGIFGLGRMISSLSEKVVEQWLQALVSKGDTDSVLAALDQLDLYYSRSDTKKQLPEKLTLEILLHPSLFKPDKTKRPSSTSDYLWKKVADAYIQQYPNKTLPIALIIVQSLGTDGSILDSYRTEAIPVLNTVAKSNPEKIWGAITKELESEKSESRYNLQQWLRGNDGFGGGGPDGFAYFRPEMVWDWVDQNVDERAWWVATFVPKVFFRSETKPCFARELLVRYGDREDVRRNLMANFSTEGWTGPRSLHLEGKKKTLEEYRAQESHPNVLKWLNEYIDIIDSDIQRAKIGEERDDW